MRLALVIVFALALLLLCVAVPADTAKCDIAKVPDAAAYVLAPTGLITLVAVERRRRRMARIRQGVGLGYCAAKRCLDVALSAAALLIAFPVFAVIALLIRLDSRGPVVFKRRVIGLNGRAFDMLKFRTMVPNAQSILEQDDHLRKEYYQRCKLVEDPRITRVGKFLRATSLDELPQLINVFLGDMTFVGPRPIAADEVEIYGPAVERFKTVKPGITGMWQTSGRSETSYLRRVELDMIYIDRRSLLLDIWIILATFPAVILKRGAY